MNIIIKEKINGRLADGIQTLLNLNEDDLQEVIERLKIESGKSIESINFYYTTDRCEVPDREIVLGLENDSKSRYYFTRERISMAKIFDGIGVYLRKIPQDSKEYLRMQSLLEVRNINALKQKYSNCNGENEELINKLFEILEDRNSFEKFLKYDENMEYFSIKGNLIDIREYFKLLGKIFGNKDEEGNLTKLEEKSNTFYIPQLDDIRKRVIEIYNTFNVDRYVDPKYEFKSVKFNEDIIRKGEEPEWNINSKLSDAIYKDMPEDLSLEEKALYVYTKLCSILEYNEEYLYRDKGVSSKFESTFSKEDLEGVIPGAKITCYDFSRIFSKLINEMEGDIEAVIISEGANQGHFLTGFYTDKISVRLEAINIDQQGRKDPTNDLMKAKNGIKLRGIKSVSDREGIIDCSLDKIYQLVYGKQALSIKGFVQELKSLPQTEIPNDTRVKLESFIEVMKERRIVGNEFVQTLDGMCKSKFFGENIEKAYIGRREERKDKKHMQRMILMRSKEEIEGEILERLYLIDTSSLALTEPDSQEIIDGLNLGELVYESNKYKIKGIDKEEQDDTPK